MCGSPAKRPLQFVSSRPRRPGPLVARALQKTSSTSGGESAAEAAAERSTVVFEGRLARSLVVVAKGDLMTEILLVDDDDDIREELGEVLRSAGYVVHEARNGQEALERLETISGPCLLVVDVMMPVMGGSELLFALKQSNRLSSLRVIALSAGDVVHQMQLANGFLPKPVLPEQLLAAVGQYCEPVDARRWVS
jgi:CheY-like chemotaxis protein